MLRKHYCDAKISTLYSRKNSRTYYTTPPFSTLPFLRRSVFLTSLGVCDDIFSRIRVDSLFVHWFFIFGLLFYFCDRCDFFGKHTPPKLPRCAASAIRPPLPPPHLHHCACHTVTATAAPLRPYDHRYRRSILTIAPATPHPPPPRCFHHMTTATVAPQPSQSSPNHPQYIITMHGSPKGQTDRDEGIVAVTSCSSVTDLAAYHNTCVVGTFFSSPLPLSLIQILILSAAQSVNPSISASLEPLL